MDTLIGDYQSLKVQGFSCFVKFLIISILFLYKSSCSLKMQFLSGCQSSESLREDRSIWSNF